MTTDAESNRDLRWQISTDSFDPEWDAFVEGSLHAHQEQTTAWGRLKGHYGWRAVRLKAHRGGALVAGAQFLEMRVGPCARIGYLCNGPIFDFHDLRLRGIVLEKIEEWSKPRYSYLVAGLPYAAQPVEEDFKQLGFETHTGRLPPYFGMNATVVLDLSQDLEAIFDQFDRGKRKKLKRSFKSDLRVRRGDAADAYLFQRLMWQLCAARGTKPTPPQVDFFANACAEFQPEKIQILVLEDSNGPVRAFFSFRCGEWLRCWKVGGNQKCPQKNPSERLMWEAIKIAKDDGIRWFDLVSVDRETVIRLRAGEKPSEQLQPDSTTVFKLSFGGEVLFLPHQLIKVYSPLVRQFLRLGADRMLKKSFGGVLHYLRARKKIR